MTQSIRQALVAEPPAMPGRRLWSALVVAPLAWIVLLMFGWWIGALQCDPWTPHATRTGLAMLAIVTFAGAAWSGYTARLSWQVLAGIDDPDEVAADDWRCFVAFAGMLVSATLGFGIVLGGLVPVLIAGCGGV